MKETNPRDSPLPTVLPFDGHKLQDRPFGKWMVNPWSSRIDFPSAKQWQTSAHQKHFKSFIYYVIKHCRGWKISGLIRCVQWRKCYLVTMGSAAWLGPHRPSKPLPLNPVRPWGFLKGMKHKCANLITMCLCKTNLRNISVVSPVKSLWFRTCRPTMIIFDVIMHWFQVQSKQLLLYLTWIFH